MLLQSIWHVLFFKNVYNNFIAYPYEKDFNHLHTKDFACLSCDRSFVDSFFKKSHSQSIDYSRGTFHGAYK